MKKIFKISMLVFAIALAVAGCRREAANFDHTTEIPADAVGYLSFAGDPLTVLWEGESVGTRSATTDTDLFTVQIIDDATQEVAKEFTYKFRGTEPIALPLGNYYIKVFSGEMKDTAYDDDPGQPTYGTESTVFDIAYEHKKETPQTVEDLTCTLESVKTTVSLEQSMAANCENVVVTFKLNDSDDRVLTFDDGTHHYGIVRYDESGEKLTQYVTAPVAGYFKPQYEENVLTMELSGRFNGENISFSKEITASAKAGQWRNVNLYIQSEEIEGGGIIIGAEIETWVYDEQVNVEISQLNPNLREDAIPDIDDPNAPRIESPSFTFHDVTRITAASYDTFGEYVGDATINIATTSATARFAVRMTTDNAQFGSALTSMGLNNVAINLMDNTDQSTLLARTNLKNWGFPSREKIEESATNTSFEIKQFLKFIKDFAGNHTVVIAVTDSEGLYSRVDMEIEVSTSGSSVAPPVSPDGEPAIVWVGYDIKQRHTITPDMTCKINIYAPKGIEKLMIAISGEIGDAIEEDLDGALPLEFDLCDTESYGEGLGQALKGFGFPVNEEVKDQTEVVDKMDISTFLSIMPDGESNFKLTVTDKEGTTVSETIMMVKK